MSNTAMTATPSILSAAEADSRTPRAAISGLPETFPEIQLTPSAHLRARLLWAASERTSTFQGSMPKDEARLRDYLATFGHESAELSLLVSLLRAEFERIVGHRRCKLSVGPVATDQCRKFHVDYVTLRLVCTLVGPGTEWLEDHNVDRAGLLDSPLCPKEANRRIVIDESKVRQAREGEVVWLPGLLATESARVHRSPPIEELGSKRFVVILTSTEQLGAKVQS